MIARNFYILPDILNESFMAATLIGKSVVAKRVYRNCPIMFPSRFKHFELVELDMVDFDVIFGMDWLHDCFASIDCRTRIVRLNFPNEPVFEWKREIPFLEVVLSLVLRLVK